MLICCFQLPYGQFNLFRSGGMLTGKIFGKLHSLKHHILHSLDRTQLIYTCVLLSFSQSLVIHDSRAEVQRFMISCAGS